MTFSEANSVALCLAPRPARRASDDARAQVRIRDGRHAATLRRVRVAGDPWLFVEADVADKDAISPAAALRLNDAIAVGALVQRDDRLTLRHALRLDGLDRETLIRTMTLVAHEAARLGSRAAAPRLTGGRALLPWLAE